MKKLFTLVELIAVIVVLGILAAIVSVEVRDMKKDGIRTAVSSNIPILQTAVDRYALENNGSYPVKDNKEIAIGNPQYIDVEKLYPKYIRSVIDYSKIKKQYYWIDFNGKVWGSTEDIATNILKSGNTLEFNLSEEVEGYSVYKVSGYTLSKASNKIIDKIHSKELPRGKTSISLELENEGNYLISTIDQYGLESAPVGPFYGGQDSFSPIFGGDGEYTFEITSFDTMYWDDFQTVQDTPGNSTIEYTFAVKDEQGAYGSYNADFFSLNPSKGIKVKVKMTKDGLNKPSLYDLKVFYHFKDEEKVKHVRPAVEKTLIGTTPIGEKSIHEYESFQPLNPVPVEEDSTVTSLVCGSGGSFTNINYKGETINGEEPKIVYSFKIGQNQSIDTISIPALSSKYRKQLKEFSYEYSHSGAPYFATNSLQDIPSESCVKLVYHLYPTLNFEDNWVPIPAPSIKTSVTNSTKIKDQESNWSKEVQPEAPVVIGPPKTPEKDDPILNDSNWVTIDTLRFFAHSGDGIKTKWINMTKVDNQPQNTRIVYRFANGSGAYWSKEVDSFNKLESSTSLMVVAYLQIHKDFVNNNQQEPPSITSINVQHERGVVDLDLVRPTGVIIPIKDNNKGREEISDESIIQWTYEGFDPRGREIVDAKWSGDIRDKYPVGTYTIKLELLNKSGYWSTPITYKLNVIQEKPTAVIGMTPDKGIQTVTQINWLDTGSFDSDGDGIKAVEWENKKPVYETSGMQTVRLRVQDNEGYWSDWAEKSFSVVDAFLVKKMAQGYDHTLFLLRNGLVKVYSSASHPNYYGELGVGQGNTGRDINSLSNIKDVFAGQYVSFALKTDGTVLAWGNNAKGELGVGMVGKVYLPTQVVGLNNVKKVASYTKESRATLFLLENGEVWGSGANLNNKLAGVIAETNVPVKIPNLTNVQDVFVTSTNSYAIMGDGSTMAWGASYGSVPKEIPQLQGMKSVVGEYSTEIFLMDNGKIKMTGKNYNSFLGTDIPYSNTEIKDVTTLSDYNIVEMTYNGYDKSVLVMRDVNNNVITVGSNDAGLRGDKSLGGSSVPNQVQNVSNVTQLAISPRHVFALKDTGEFYWWGIYNSSRYDPKIGDWYKVYTPFDPIPF